ncbi:precorrin-3 methyltransferase [Paraburkholderia fungorum]|uniref:Precorrin-3 methyltransferase n=2 Tax=Paraburkholderia fungorum TaxID=134537 RepID=A0A1H1I1F0_9BURK|nr:precorrin-3 methyltransferase [Paraburkholderia fungorum]
MTAAPAIVILGAGALETARRIQALYRGRGAGEGERLAGEADVARTAGDAHASHLENAANASGSAAASNPASASPAAPLASAACQIHALQGRVEADAGYTELGAHLCELYARGTPIVALCAAGIVIRCLAPMLSNKGVEPPVLAVAEDGSAVVPLLGGLAGVNVMAREIAAALAVAPAITTSGELRFGTCVLNPPEGYALADIGQGKRFVSDLLAGESTRIEGDAPWLDDARLPRSENARLAIRVTPRVWDGREDDLVIHPRSVVAAVTGFADAADRIAARVRDSLDAHRLAPLSLAALLTSLEHASNPALAEAAALLDVPLRFTQTRAEDNATPASLLQAALRVPYETLDDDAATGIALALTPLAIDPHTIGRARGRLTVIGLGPGSADLMVPAARAALDEATDILGYDTYVKMAGPLRASQRVHGTDNREEMQRARHAFDLASEGRSVVMVSSGDPGVFAMAAAVLEALDEDASQASQHPAWSAVELKILPGVSAAMAAAAQAGAPLGHDFCMLSLSDNLKPWSIIERRLRHAADADLVMAFYNPISRARPWQLDKALDIVREYRSAQTVVVLGRDVGRPGGTRRTLTLGELRSSDVDMRTMVIVGSSTTRRFGKGKLDGDEWVYTPRWYK